MFAACKSGGHLPTQEHQLQELKDNANAQIEKK